MSPPSTVPSANQLTVPVYMHTFGDIAKSFLLPKRILDHAELTVAKSAELPSFDESLEILQYEKTHCAVDGCEKISRRSGLCNQHNGTTKKRPCSKEGCEVYAIAKTLCYFHGGLPTCRIQDCNNPVIKRNLCISHLRKKPNICATKGCTNYQTQRRGNRCGRHTWWTKCIVDDCRRQRKAKGLCGTHLREIGIPRCILGDCQNEVMRLGLCKEHMY